MNSMDVELEATKVIYEQLLRLERPARERALRFAQDRVDEATRTCGSGVYNRNTTCGHYVVCESCQKKQKVFREDD